jgi:iron complex outermembrane receptor protein
LHGPQSILFGKNTIAGALNLSTARPTNETEISISGLYEFESNQTELNAAISGAITDDFRARYVIDSRTNVNLRFGAQNDNWRVSIIGKNLSNEDVLTYAGNAPISNSLFGTNTFYGFVARPRQIALEIAYTL